MREDISFLDLVSEINYCTDGITRHQNNPRKQNLRKAGQVSKYENYFHKISVFWGDNIYSFSF
jgi:hypothetical protein